MLQLLNCHRKKNTFRLKSNSNSNLKVHTIPRIYIIKISSLRNINCYIIVIIAIIVVSVIFIAIDIIVTNNFHMNYFK